MPVPAVPVVLAVSSQRPGGRPGGHQPCQRTLSQFSRSRVAGLHHRLERPVLAAADVGPRGQKVHHHVVVPQLCSRRQRGIVLGMDIRSGCQQHAHRIQAVAQGRVAQRTVVLRMHVRARGQQQRQDVGVPLAAGMVQRRRVPRIRVGARCEQEADHVRVARRARRSERLVEAAPPLGLGRMCATLQEPLHEGSVPRPRRGMQRVGLPKAVRCVHARSGREQEVAHVHAAVPDRRHQRLLHVVVLLLVVAVGAGRPGLPLLLQEARQHMGVPALHHVLQDAAAAASADLHAGLQQPLHDVEVPVPAREQERPRAVAGADVRARREQQRDDCSVARAGRHHQRDRAVGRGRPHVRAGREQTRGRSGVACDARRQKRRVHRIVNAGIGQMRAGKGHRGRRAEGMEGGGHRASRESGRGRGGRRAGRRARHGHVVWKGRPLRAHRCRRDLQHSPGRSSLPPAAGLPRLPTQASQASQRGSCASPCTAKTLWRGRAIIYVKASARRAGTASTSGCGRGRGPRPTLPPAWAGPRPARSRRRARARTSARRTRCRGSPGAAGGSTP